MLYTKIQSESSLISGEEDFQLFSFFFFFLFFVFLSYMGMVAILFNSVEPFEQTVNIPSTESSMLNLVKIGQVVSEKKMF